MKRISSSSLTLKVHLKNGFPGFKSSPTFSSRKNQLSTLIFAKLRPDRVKTKTSSNMMYKSSDYTVVIRVKLTFFPSDAKINIMQSPERLKQQRTAWRKHNFKSDYTHSHLRNLSIFASVWKQRLA